MKRTTTAPKLLCAMLFAAFGVAGNANALVLSTSDTSESFSWTFTDAGYTMAGMGTMSIASLTSTTLTLNITLNDNSTFPSGGVPKHIRLTAFGFAIDPNTTGVTFSDDGDGGMIDAALASIPSLKTIEVCAYGGNNCPGGSNGGIWAGDEDTFTLTLTGTWGNSVTIDPIGFKYQTKIGSYEFVTTSGGPPTTGPVPEPGTITLLGLGLLGTLFYRRRTERRA